MAYFTNDFLGHRRNQWLRSIYSVEVQVDGKWYKGDIGKKEVEDDTIVILATFPELDKFTCTITASRIIDVRGEVAAYQQRVVEKISGQGTMIKLTIPIYEVSN